MIDVQRLHEIRCVGHDRLVHAIEPHLYGPRLHARAVQHILEPDADPASVTHRPVRPFAAGDTGLEEAARIARTLIEVLSLSLQQVLSLPRVELAAVNQCSGNSRGFFQPRVAGGEWANGAMGNTRWIGVRLKDVLDRAGVKAGAVQVRFNGMDEPVVSDAPDFMKSLDIDHARDGEVMIAYEMNGEQLSLLNGFPLRLVVPGWYATYWVKMLNDIEVLDRPDDNYWTKTAYTIPDTHHADMKPGETGVKMVPINRMVPRSFITNIKPGETVQTAAPTLARGIAFGGDSGIAEV